MMLLPGPAGRSIDLSQTQDRPAACVPVSAGLDEADPWLIQINGESASLWLPISESAVCDEDGEDAQ